MKLRTIRLENVRRFIDPVEVGGNGDGINVLSAPNEHGKSTVFDALHAVFFKPRKSWDREIRSLAPHAGGDPSVAVEIQLADGVYRIEKRWSSRRNGDARIEIAGRLIKQADEAETWIAETLKAPRDGGPAGLLWVRQELTGLDDSHAARLARRDLLTSVAGEVEAMTGAADVRKSALARAKAAADMSRRALLAESAAAATRHRENLIEKVEREEELRRRAEQASADARTALSAPVLEEIDKLDESVRVLRRARDLEAAAVVMTYAPGRTAFLSMEDRFRMARPL